MWGSPLNKVDLPRTTPLQKTDSVFPMKPPLPVAPQVGVGAGEALPTPCRRVEWLDPAQATAVAVSL